MHIHISIDMYLSIYKYIDQYINIYINEIEKEKEIYYRDFFLTQLWKQAKQFPYAVFFTFYTRP